MSSVLSEDGVSAETGILYTFLAEDNQHDLYVF